MPFYTHKATLTTDGPNKTMLDLSQGFRFPFRPLDTDLMSNKILWKGTFDESEQTFTCATPCFRVDIEQLHSRNLWDWFLEYFAKQPTMAEPTVFYEPDATDIRQTNKFLKAVKDPEGRCLFELPMFVIEKLIADGLINDENDLELFKLRKQVEESKKYAIEKEVAKVAEVADETETKSKNKTKVKVEAILKEQDPLKELTK